MQEGFDREQTETSETAINLARGGSEAPMLILHEYPLAHVMQPCTAPFLATRYSVVAPDLRGYGKSHQGWQSDRGLDMLRVRRQKAEHVQERALDSGHFFAEEAPKETHSKILEFLNSVSRC